MTDLHLYNTLTRKLERFEPLKAGKVGLYVCGPTVYDRAHIGNARSAINFDLLYRVLRHLYGAENVTYARNFTDVDDKIITRAAESGEPIGTITARATDQYHEDTDALLALRPDVEPRATEHIPQMVELIGKLIERGHAYEAEGHVLFNVPSMENYGALSRRPRDEQIAGARVDVAPYKRDPADFVLWKPSTDEQPGWDSPYGRGRPGWHLECSAMSEAHLGLPFDIHAGGDDLIVPHHENEIAQSCCAHGSAEYARYWVHNGMLLVDGQKMSKSLGNFYTVADIREKANGEVIRQVLLSGHYRAPLDFTFDRLDQAKSILDRLYTAIHKAETALGRVVEPAAPDAVVVDALCDDLNAPLAFSHLHELTGDLNKATDQAEQADLTARLKGSAQLMGFLQQPAEDWLKGGATDSDEDAEIDALIAKRADAKANRDFATADAIRDDLTGRGILLEDSASGTTWRRK
ncbi:MAG: cysteine--tRNA ligase [Alphaproteobacteria bacterium]